MSKRIPLLDLLRFIAAFAVMLMHIFIRGFENDAFYQHDFNLIGAYFKWNYLAVNLFFLISGFVIFLTAENRTAMQFIKSRFLRLYPAYWVACTLSFVVSYLLLQHILHPSWFRYIANMTMLNGFFNIGNIDSVYWTLLVEIKFYILILFVVALNKIHHAEKLLWGWLAIAFINYFYKIPALETWFITNYAPFFIGGCTIYLMAKENFKLTSGKSLLLVASFFTGFLYEASKLASKQQHFDLSYSPSMLLLLLVAIYAIFILSVRYTDIPEAWSNVFSELGKASYPLYLIHLNLALAALNTFSADGEHRYLIALLMIVLLPVAAYLIAIKLEEPLRGYLKNKLR